MKNQTLSIEQMKHLRNLGVDTSKASMVCLFIDDDGNEVDWDLIERHGSDQTHYYFDDEYEHDNGEFGGWIPIAPRFYDAETGYYDHSSRESCGVFTLQDMLEMIPGNIRLNYNFELSKIGDSWLAGYLFLNTNNSIFPIFSNPRLIDLTYNFLCWLAENGYMKGGNP